MIKLLFSCALLLFVNLCLTDGSPDLGKMCKDTHDHLNMTSECILDCGGRSPFKNCPIKPIVRQTHLGSIITELLINRPSLTREYIRKALGPFLSFDAFISGTNEALLDVIEENCFPNFPAQDGRFPQKCQLLEPVIKCLTPNGMKNCEAKLSKASV